MPAPPRVLLCGSARATLAAVARELARARATLLIQAAPGEELSRAESLRRSLARRGATAAIVRAELGGDRQGRTLVARAWKAERAIDAVVVCPALAAGAGGNGSPDLEQWRAALGAGLRAPFFLAKHAGPRLARGGGKLVFAIGPAPRGGPAAAIVREGLLAMIEGLASALPGAVAVIAVLADERLPARRATAQLAHGVGCVLAPDWSARGALLELGGPRRRG